MQYKSSYQIENVLMVFFYKIYITFRRKIVLAKNKHENKRR